MLRGSWFQFKQNKTKLHHFLYPLLLYHRDRVMTHDISFYLPIANRCADILNCSSGCTTHAPVTIAPRSISSTNRIFKVFPGPDTILTSNENHKPNTQQLQTYSIGHAEPCIMDEIKPGTIIAAANVEKAEVTKEWLKNTHLFVATM